MDSGKLSKKKEASRAKKEAARLRKLERDRERMRKKRENPEFRKEEANRRVQRNEESTSEARERHAEVMRLKRDDETYRAKEQEKNTAARRQARKDAAYRAMEQARNTAARRRARQDEAYREMERQRNAAARRRARQDLMYRVMEQERNTAAKRRARQDAAFREMERERNAAARRRARQDQAYRAMEQARDTAAKRRARQDLVYRAMEQERDTAARKRARMGPEFRQEDMVGCEDSWNRVVERVGKAIQQAPTHVCACCGRLWLKSSMQTLHRDDVISSGMEMGLVDKIYEEGENADQAEFCAPCATAIKKGEVPEPCLADGLDECEVPPVLGDFGHLEESLIDALHMFQTIWPVMGPTGGHREERSIGDDHVNGDITMSSLPRLEDDTHGAAGVSLPLKKLYDVARRLVTLPFHRDDGASLCEDWDVEEPPAPPLLMDEDSYTGFDDGSEDLPPFSPGGGDTMMMSDVGATHTGHRPISVLLEEDIEMFDEERINPMLDVKPDRSDLALLVARKLLSVESPRTRLRKRTYDKRPVRDLVIQAFVDCLSRPDCAVKVFQGIRTY